MWEWTGHLKSQEMAFQTQERAGAKPRGGKDETEANVPEESRAEGGVGDTCGFLLEPKESCRTILSRGTTGVTRETRM